MKTKKIIQCFILIISTFLFLYQVYIAVVKLSSKEAIDSSEKLSWTDPRIQLPIITVCKLGQIPSFKLLDNVTFWSNPILNLHYLEDGETFSFGKHLNMTYMQLMRKMSQYANSFVGFSQKDSLDHKEVFLQQFGFCFSLDSYDPDVPIVIQFYGIEDSHEIFVTDPRTLTSFSIEFASHIGEKMEIKPAYDYVFTLDVQIEDLTDPYNSDNCVAEDDKYVFAVCVDENIKSDQMSVFGCILPWLSPDHQCHNTYQRKNSTMNKHIFGRGAVYEDYLLPGYYFEHNKAQKACKKPCLKTQVLVKQRRKQPELGFYSVDLLMNPEVVFKKKIVAYDLFNFVGEKEIALQII